MTDSSVDTQIVIKSEDGLERPVEFDEFKDLLDKAARIESVTASITVTRSIPRDKFEKNSYFISVGTSIGSLYDLVDQAGERTPKIMSGLSQVVMDRVNKAFNLCRVQLRMQQENDGIEVVNLGDHLS